MAQPDPKRTPTSKSYWLLLSLLAVLIALTAWTHKKWDQVWVKPTEAFFLEEWKQNTNPDDLAWRYPIYRSNDTYQWVALANGLARNDNQILQHRFDEGPEAGRPSAWHSGLPRLMHFAGSNLARLNDWPAMRGIHSVAHWMGAYLQLIIILIVSLYLLRNFGTLAALLFAAFYFFTAAIRWDFAFSRLDHDVFFQVALLLQLLGLYHLTSEETKRTSLNKWAVLAGFGAALSWWIGATVQAAIGSLIVLASLCTDITSAPSKNKTIALHKSPWLLWGACASLGILGFSLLDKRWPFSTSINTMHPVFIVAQIGASLVCACGLRPETKSKRYFLFIGLLLGLSPLGWIAAYGGEAHVWFDPLQHRFHKLIIEMQSPFLNGLWNSRESVSLSLIAAVALYLTRWRIAPTRALGIVLTGLTLLALYQTRWIGLAATTASLAICLNLSAQMAHSTRPTNAAIRVCGILILLFAATWLHHWKTISLRSNKSLLVDFYVQIAARDINFNMQSYGQGKPTRVVLPMSFAATSSLFPNVYPLGTFYWENRTGLAAASAIYAATDHTEAGAIIRENKIEYLVVSRLQLGILFAKMANEISHGSTRPPPESTLAWKLSFGKDIPSWCEEITYNGSIDPRIFSARVYKIQNHRP